MREKSWNCCAEIQLLHTISEWEILLLAVKALVILTNLAKYWARLQGVSNDPSANSLFMCQDEDENQNFGSFWS